MVLTELRVHVFNLILDNGRVAEASLIDYIHALLKYQWMGGIAHLKQCTLFEAKDAVIDIQVGCHEVKDVCSRAFLQTSRQFKQAQAEKYGDPLPVEHFVLHPAL